MSAKFYASAVTVLWMSISGCHRESPPLMVGGPYGTILIDANTVLHQGGKLRLYQFSPNGQRQLIWPSLLLRDEAVVGNLIVFNGFTSSDGSSFYAPLLAFAGTGTVVELSQPLARRLTVRSLGTTNYAFAVTTLSNGVIHLRASQRPPIDRTKPITLNLDTTKDEIVQMMAEAQTNGLRRKYRGVAYVIAQ